MDSATKYWIWLSSLVKIIPRKRLALLKYFGDPASLWEADEHDLRASMLCTPKMISYLRDPDMRNGVDSIAERVSACGANVITYHDPAYPQALKYTEDPPAVLYCRGKLLPDELCVAIVGSRRATWYGLDMSKRLSSELAKHGVTVVSGMARGVDSKAHCGALEAGGRTIAVLGCGVDIVYPKENRSLMEEICRKGAVISEFLPGTEPIPFNFPARNRIISGLSQGVVIVEASEKSGSLITADYALEQGRDVFAVPGNINSMNSSGTNRLIREGARIITCAGDILDELNISHESNLNFYERKKLREMKPALSALLSDATGGAGKCGRTSDTGGIPAAGKGGGPAAEAETSEKKPGEAGIQLGIDERTIADKLLCGPAHIDAIARDCGISVQLAGSILLMLELSGFVEQLPGKFYRLLD